MIKWIRDKFKKKEQVAAEEYKQHIDDCVNDAIVRDPFDDSEYIELLTAHVTGSTCVGQPMGMSARYQPHRPKEWVRPRDIPAQEKEPDIIECQYCGARNEPDALECRKCGGKPR